LLADTDKKVCIAYGVIKEKNMYGKKVMGIERTTFLIDAAGKIARIFPKVKPDGHAEEVLAALKS
jgi:thioredoxin-dependent peroxiredoxin